MKSLFICFACISSVAYATIAQEKSKAEVTTGAKGNREQIDYANPNKQEIVQILKNFKRRVELASEIQFSKSESGTVAVIVSSTRFKESLNELADCIGEFDIDKMKVDKPIRPTKPPTTPAWTIEIKQEGDLPKELNDGDKMPKSVLLEGANIRFVIGSQSVICELEREISYSKSDKIWSLFGELLIANLR